MSEFEVYIGFIFLLESIVLGKLQKSIGRSFEISRAADPVAQELFGYDQGEFSVINLYIHKRQTVIQKKRYTLAMRFM